MTTPGETPDTSTDEQEPRPDDQEQLRDEQGPGCDEEEFAQLAEELVADYAPRLFALIAEVGERVNGHLTAWSGTTRTPPPPATRLPDPTPHHGTFRRAPRSPGWRGSSRAGGDRRGRW